MHAIPIEDPYPVWSLIKNRLSDDSGELDKSGPFIGVFENSEMLGAFSIKIWNDHCYQIHGGVRPDQFGRGAKICDVMGRTLLFNTPCLKIVAIIPGFNRLMRACVQKIGLKQEGVVTKSFLKWSRLHDQYVYGITKGEARLWPPQQ